ncbi:capsule biosynthesis protein [Roseibaca sp. Y0-43]|uniref:capsule biosynthesis protein n=1 Tax=Roseibaca sp. Y0-43 TaxID=2816854 RepID=UPI001D0CD28F|nr:capsule biosynthesis protein [Roseibaca sp. Y0-43]MCC1482096.1 capsule biosynthesis protein [Roseibaca sp. Y0-43]
MTTPVKSKRFRLRRTDEAAQRATTEPAPRPAPVAEELTPRAVEPTPHRIVLQKRARVSPTEGNAPKPAPETSPPTAGATAKPDDGLSADTDLDIIRQEGLTARQLRMAMRVAQKHGIRATSAYEAVLMLRKQGVDPFSRATMLELVRDEKPEDTSRALTTAPQTSPAPVGDAVSSAQERMAKIAADRDRELQKMQRQIVKRRRKRLLLLGARILAFVTFPTFLATYYFYMIATPMYATESEFIIQQADSGPSMAGDLSSMMPSAAGMGLGGQQEAASVQSFLQSRGAMLRLDREEGFRAHFSQPELDIWRRLPPDASSEEAFKTYNRHVRISYDPTEGVVGMEVIAATPEDSERFARALLTYAEEHVDMMTQRLRDSQMREARQSLEEAQLALIQARQDIVALQEQSSVLSGEVEVQLISQQIVALETELTQTQLTIQEMRTNARPNPARLMPLERRAQALQEQIDGLRASMTQGSGGDASLASIQSQLIMAEAEVQTREMMRAQAMQQLEAARMEVSRQVRYLALTVEPIASDEAVYPRKLANSSLAFLLFAGIYLFASMTGSVLREQVSG